MRRKQLKEALPLSVNSKHFLLTKLNKMSNYKFQSTKYFGHDRGLSCCFRQWRASHSHCSTLHGYAVSLKLVFEAETLDDRNWIYDFGNFKKFKEWAEYMFDHTLLIAQDDPELEFFKEMAARSTRTPKEGETQPFQRGAVCDLRIVPAVGCEMFSKMAYEKMLEILEESKKDASNNRYPVNPNVRLKSVEVAEHAGNSAIFLTE